MYRYSVASLPLLNRYPDFTDPTRLSKSFEMCSTRGRRACRGLEPTRLITGEGGQSCEFP